MTIEPDTKDWTWVITRACPECGLGAHEIEPEQVPDLLRANAARWPELLAQPEARERSRPDRWSTLEYACHVRDVCTLFAQRLALMLTEDGPTFANWDQDATAVESRYAEQDPAVVANELLAAAAVTADAFGRVTGEQWQRTGLRSDGAAFTVAGFARYFIHDVVHHLHDVTVGAGRP